MTTKLDLPEELVEGVRRRAADEGRRLDETVANLLRIGLATAPVHSSSGIRADASMLEERKRIADKFITGQWGVELAGFAEGRAADRESAEVRSRAWRR